MTDVACAVCGMAFPEEGALELGASRIERGGTTYWFCSPYCEQEFRAAPEKFVS